jgi:putative RecB family exonuclease
MSVEPTPFVKKYAPWSASKADTAKQCPLKFKYAYIQKTAKGRPGEEAQVGITVHRILELCLTGKSLDDAKGIALNDPKVTLLTVEREKIEAAMPAVATFLRRTFAFIDKLGGADLLVEKKIASTFTGNPTAFYNNAGLLRGVLDVGILFKDRPHLMVIDHKTGKNRGLGYYNWQFLAYTLLAKANYPEITHVIPAIHWVQDEYTDVGKPIEVSGVAEWVDKVVEHLNTTTRAAAENLDNVQPSRLCDWCDYQALCPAKDRATGELHGDQVQEQSLLPSDGGL